MTSSLNNADRQRCLQYLLGELTDSESAKFESQLATSTELNRELLVQSELVYAISTQQSDAINEPATAAPAIPARQPSTAAWRLVTRISALAACVTFAYLGFRMMQKDDQSVAPEATTEEALLIAQAWASNHSADAATEADLAVSETEYDLNLDDASDHDSVLSWMVVAVAADADTLAEETTSDG